MESEVNKIERIDSDVPLLEFFDKYLQPNKPCILSATATEEWPSRRQWVTDNGQPDFDFLRRHFGDSIVPVADCKVKHYDSQMKRDMKLSEYLDYWQDLIDRGYPEDANCLYLKDWHFTRVHPDYLAYRTPPQFVSDWLNEFWEKRADADDDYKFVYMGPKGSWTPFHADVFRSFSWSANVCGRKRWLLCKPGSEQKLKGKSGSLPYDLQLVEGCVEGLIDVVQEAGEVIFVPSNWYHQVYNLENTISINHNWFNGSNIEAVENFLFASLTGVQKEIEDCRDMDGWHQQCQLLLKATHGMDFTELFRLLHCIGAARTRAVAECVTDGEKPLTHSQFNLTQYDLCRVHAALKRLVSVDEWQYVNADQLPCCPKEFIESLVSTLQDIKRSENSSAM